MKKGALSIYLLLSLMAPVMAQDIKVSAAFDTSRIFIGDQIKFSVTVDQPEGMQISIPEFKDSIITHIDILSGPRTDSVRNLKGNLRIRKEYLVTSFDSGRYQIPPVFAELKTEEGIKRFYSDYTYLDVQRTNIAPADTTAKIFDIVAPYKAPITLGEILPWILIVLLVAAAVYYALRFYKKLRKNPDIPEIVKIPEPAHIIAFRELEKLKEEKLWQKGGIKLYYTRLTEILRQYLENRFQVYSLELTTSETLDALVRAGFKRDAKYEKIKAVLNGADMIKFAKYNPEPTENESYFQDAWNFVEETKLTETVIPGDQENKVKAEVSL
jgi:hypothetical protein